MQKTLRRSLTRACAVVAGVAAIAAASQSASAASITLLNEDFTGVVIGQATLTTTTNLNTWLDLPTAPARWGIDSGAACSAPCAGSFARHLNPPSGDHTNILYYGVAAPSGVQDLTLSFDFIKQTPPTTDGTAYIIGMDGGDTIDPFAPFFDGGVTILGSLSLNSGDWASTSFSADVLGAYDAFAVAFVMRGTSTDGGVRGVDNIELTANTVPEPAALSLLSIGLIGLALARRRRR